MTTLLVSHRVGLARRADLERRARESGFPLEVIALPEDPEARIAEADAQRIEAAYFSIDVNPRHARQFFSAVRKAPKLSWMHLFNVGVDHPVFTEMLGRGVRLTTSAGTSARPIAHNAITGLLMLARDFPRWMADQRAHKWSPSRPPDVPRDLAEQTAVVIGLGHIGAEIARLAQALGLRVIGVRRTPRRRDDTLDEICHPGELLEVAPRADWLVIACPLTPETRGLVSAEVISRLPPHAGVVNIARGEIVDEGALIDALRAGRLGGAYLDVFQKEPLPENSPFWDLPNVILTPHNSAFDRSLDDRIYELFAGNLARRHRGEPLLNEVTTTTGGKS